VGDLVVREQELSALSGALASAGRRLLDVTDARRDLVSLVETSPSAAVRDAVEELLTSWELVVWDAADELVELAGEARRTAEGFARVERTLRGGPLFEVPVVVRP
jgi:hypothetical protein